MFLPRIFCVTIKTNRREFTRMRYKSPSKTAPVDFPPSMNIDRVLKIHCIGIVDIIIMPKCYVFRQRSRVWFCHSRSLPLIDLFSEVYGMRHVIRHCAIIPNAPQLVILSAHRHFVSHQRCSYEFRGLTLTQKPSIQEWYISIAVSGKVTISSPFGREYHVHCRAEHPPHNPYSMCSHWIGKCG